MGYPFVAAVSFSVIWLFRKLFRLNIYNSFLFFPFKALACFAIWGIRHKYMHVVCTNNQQQSPFQTEGMAFIWSSCLSTLHSWLLISASILLSLQSRSRDLTYSQDWWPWEHLAWSSCVAGVHWASFWHRLWRLLPCPPAGHPHHSPLLLRHHELQVGRCWQRQK